MQVNKVNRSEDSVSVFEQHSPDQQETMHVAHSLPCESYELGIRKEAQELIVLQARLTPIRFPNSIPDRCVLIRTPRSSKHI